MWTAGGRRVGMASAQMLSVVWVFNDVRPHMIPATAKRAVLVLAGATSLRSVKLSIRFRNETFKRCNSSRRENCVRY